MSGEDRLAWTSTSESTWPSSLKNPNSSSTTAGIDQPRKLFTVQGKHAIVMPFVLVAKSIQWTRGTGKYAGIRGNNAFRFTGIGDTPRGWVIWEGEWELP